MHNKTSSYVLRFHVSYLNNPTGPGEPVGSRVGGQATVPAGELDYDDARCPAAGVPEMRRAYRSKTELALEMVEQALVRGHLQAQWVAGDDAFGVSPSFREGLSAWGCVTSWTYRQASRCGLKRHSGPVRRIRVAGVPSQTQAAKGATADHAAAGRCRPGSSLAGDNGVPGSQGPRVYQFSAQRVWPTARRRPGEIHWAVYRRNRDGGEPRYYLPTPRRTLPGEPGLCGRLKVAHRNRVRDREERRGTGRVRSPHPVSSTGQALAGWHHHIAMCLLAGAFLLTLQQDWGKKMPQITRPQVYRVVRELLPRQRFGPPELLRWLEGVQRRNQRAQYSHKKRRATLQRATGVPP